ncbi:hypothetical protein HDC37_000797 [Microbacterium sp. AK009]|uniref:hypothetical protein n=1 Tax=Microbacterium sp. AK009 TaxID=2723068 RepID=UPI0015CEAAA9|nr:hypothetical protein [Microbacterium sp. AK009]NYF15983.1 hypothetical protein [Microbacterium sp. AK009]
MISIDLVPRVPLTPEDLVAAADELGRAAAGVPDQASAVVSAWQPITDAYDTDHTDTVSAAMAPVTLVTEDVADTAVAVAGALQALGEELALVQTVLVSLASDVVAHRERFPKGESDPLWPLLGESTDADLRDQCTRAQQRIDEAVGECVRTLRGIEEPVVVGLPSASDSADIDWAEVEDSLTTGLGFALLNSLAGSDAITMRRLLALHPEWEELLRLHPPDPSAVADWWTSLADPERSTSAAQTALIFTAPAIIGALGGVPAAARVTANRQLARDRLSDARQRLSRLEAARDSAPVSYYAQDKEIEQLRAEIAYLEKATRRREDGTYAVQLYLYDPAHHRLIEMFGTPTTETLATVTYSPGTFTTEQSFYGGDVQHVARWLNQRNSDVVVFVWKDGVFPGAVNPDDVVRGLMEANDIDRALASGRRVANFQQGMLTDPHLANTYQVGIGHSWGLANIAASEVAEARYDQVESLAGAYLPTGWEPSRETVYTHQSYTDFLSIAQDLGAVGGGNVPDENDAFTSTVYEREGDFDLYLPSPSYPSVPTGPPPFIPATIHPERNHSLIAGTSAENIAVLDRIRDRIEDR